MSEEVVVRKRALLVGCNYPGTEAQLQGCINDVFRVKSLLLEHYGFGEQNIMVLIDTDDQYPAPTGANIRNALTKISRGTEPGDIILFHFSGHGVQVPSESGHPEDDGLDECIVPCDLNLLSDTDFREILNTVPVGVNFTFIADCCHSGGLIDKGKEQIGPVAGDRSMSIPGVKTRGFDFGGGGGEGEGEGRWKKYRPPGEEEQEGYGGGEEGGYGGQRRQQEEWGGGDGDGGEEGYGRRQQRYGGEEEGGGYGGREGGGGYGGGYGGDEGGYRQRQEESYGEEGGYNSRRGNEEGGYGVGEGAYGGGEGEEERTYGEEEEVVVAPEWGGCRVEEMSEVKNRSMPLDMFASLLGQKTGQDVVPGNVRTSLFQAFGADASPMVQSFVGILAKHAQNYMMGKRPEGGVMGLLGSVAMDFVKAQMSQGGGPMAAMMGGGGGGDDEPAAEPPKAGKKPPHSQQVPRDLGILVSGCQSNEKSADANPTGNPAEAYGALTNAIYVYHKENAGRPFSNKDLVKGVRKSLKAASFGQNPCLYCDDGPASRPFLTG